MKNFLAFILILASKSLFACGFYPYGEELRFSFFNPKIAGYKSYSEFYYSANTFEPKDIYDEFDKMPNEVLWVSYCKNKVSYKSVEEVLQSFSQGDINPETNNEMLRYLYKIKDYEAINYLKFAKNCEFFNSWVDDPWERNEAMALPQRTKLLNQAIKLSQSTANKTLQFRYTFLAIRMAFYNRDLQKIKMLFDTVYQVKLDKDVLYYWSLYFRTLAEEDKALANFYAAQVFVNSPDKRFMISQQFNNEVAIDDVLKYAKTNKEKANVYLLAAIKKHDKSLEYIKKVYEYQSNFEGLSFLLLREVNKIEDWVFTPYYSLFEPSVTTNSYWDNEENSITDVLKRVETDREYASQLLDFINSVDLTSVENQTFWKTCKAYLLYITKDYKASLTLLEELKSDKIIEQPVYSFVTHNRTDDTIITHPRKVMIVEGILILTNPELRDMFDIKVYVHADSDERLIRRLKRDIAERGRDMEEVLNRYQNTLKPMHEQFIEPTKAFADIIIPNDKYNTVAIDVVRAVINQRIS